MSATDLTETTVRYLYATTWLPTETTEWTVAVPGGSTKAIDTAGNLLQIALLNLRRIGAMDLEQLRPVEEEYVRAFGGQSFSRFELRDPSLSMPGLEGALLQAATTIPSQEGFVTKRMARVSKEHDHGLRRLLRQLALDGKGPWKTVCGHCFAEAHAAGLVEVQGRLFKKIVITDPAAVESLAERHAELRATRNAEMDAEPELTNAIIADCLRTVVDGYSPRGGDSL